MFSFASPKIPHLLASSIIASLALIPEQVNAQNPSVIPTVTATQINEQKSIVNYYDIHHPVIGRKGMVVSQSDLASKVGADILQQGGNAIDAAVAVGFALAVVLPRAGN